MRELLRKLRDLIFQNTDSVIIDMGESNVVTASGTLTNIGAARPLPHGITITSAQVSGYIVLTPRTRIIDTPYLGDTSAGFFSRAPSVGEEKGENNYISEDLKQFITSRRKPGVSDKVCELSKSYDAAKEHLCCPISRDFPLIPVRFNGRLYDYDNLIMLVQNSHIKDPSTRRMVKLYPDVIQPDYAARDKMEELLVEIQSRVLTPVL